MVFRRRKSRTVPLPRVTFVKVPPQRSDKRGRLIDARRREPMSSPLSAGAQVAHGTSGRAAHSGIAPEGVPRARRITGWVVGSSSTEREGFEPSIEREPDTQAVGSAPQPRITTGHSWGLVALWKRGRALFQSRACARKPATVYVCKNPVPGLPSPYDALGRFGCRLSVEVARHLLQQARRDGVAGTVVGVRGNLVRRLVERSLHLQQFTRGLQDLSEPGQVRQRQLTFRFSLALPDRR